MELLNDLQPKLTKISEIIQQYITEIKNQITKYTNLFGNMNFIEEKDAEVEI